jgi:hypothetical protein
MEWRRRTKINRTLEIYVEIEIPYLLNETEKEKQIPGILSYYGVGGLVEFFFAVRHFESVLTC